MLRSSTKVEISIRAFSSDVSLTGNFVKVVQRIPVKIVFDRPEELAEYLLVPGMSVVPEVNVKADVPATAAADSVQKIESRSVKR